MKKSKSFSAYGKYLQIRASLTTNPQTLLKSAQRATQNPLKVQKPQPKFIQGFNRVTSRDKLNSFQLFNVKDFNNQANYQVKQQLIKTKSSFYPIRRQKQQRLNNLIFDRQYQRAEHFCKKCPTEERNQKIVTTRDLQNLRKSFHSLDFKKQSERANTYIPKPVGYHNQQQIQPLATTMSQKKLLNIKLSKTHSFDSYTKRDFLSAKKLSQRVAPPDSGLDSFKVPLQKFKGGWKTVAPQQFSKSPKKTLSRYDSTNDPFYTKLGYHPKQQLVTKKIPVMDISQQTTRKINQVHSKYPFRIAI